jgi:hypothetical protein
VGGVRGFLTGNGPDLGNDDPWTQVRKAPPARGSRSGMRTSRDEQTLEGQYQIAQPAPLLPGRDRTDRSENPGLSMRLSSVGGLRSGSWRCGDGVCVKG